MTDSDAAVAPTISGTVGGQTTTFETPIAPFTAVTITDANDGGTDNDTLTLTYTGPGTLSGTGLSGTAGDYTLSGTAAGITTELHGLEFTPVDGVPNTLGDDDLYAERQEQRQRDDERGQQHDDGDRQRCGGSADD